MLDAIRKAREWILTTSKAKEQLRRHIDALESREPLYSPEDILGIMNPDIRLPLDMMEVLLRTVDSSRIELFKPQYGKGMITAWAHIHGTYSAQV